MRPSPHTAIILALAAVGCGYRNPPRGPTAELDAPTGRQCLAARTPARLPAVGDLVAVGALHAGLAGAALAPGTTVLTLRFDRQGRPIRNEVLVAGAGYATSLSVRDALDRAVRVQPPGPPWGVRLLVTTGGPLRLHVERQEICPAVALDSHILGGYASVDGSAGAAPPFGFRPDFDNSFGRPGYREAHARVYVTSQGRVGQASLADPGLLSADNAGRGLGPQGPLGWLYDVAFEPTLVDGVPTASWVDIWFYMPAAELDQILSDYGYGGGYAGYGDAAAGYDANAYGGYYDGYANGGYAGYGYGGYARYGAGYTDDAGYGQDADADDAGYGWGYGTFGDLPFGYAGWGYGGYGYGGYGYGGFGYGYGYGGYTGYGYGGLGYGYGGLGYGYGGFGYGYGGFGYSHGYGGYGYGAGPGGWTLFSLPRRHRPASRPGSGPTGTGTSASGHGRGSGQSGTGGITKVDTVRARLPLDHMPGVRPHTPGTPLHPVAPQSRPAVGSPWTVGPRAGRPAAEPHPVPLRPGSVAGGGNNANAPPWPRLAAPASASMPRPAPTTRAGTRTGPGTQMSPGARTGPVARHPQSRPRVWPQPMPGTFQRWDHPRPAPTAPTYGAPAHAAPRPVYRGPSVYRTPPTVWRRSPVVRTAPRPVVHTGARVAGRHPPPRPRAHHGGHVHHRHFER